MLYTTIDSPIGELLLVGDGSALHHLSMQGGRRPLRRDAAWTRDDGAFEDVLAPARRVLRRHRPHFDLPLSLGGNPFEQRVWGALREIPYGETVELRRDRSSASASPDAARAVGLANGRNPVAVIVPCHRVIGADGTLTGYGGGLERKRLLLDLEAGVLSRSSALRGDALAAQLRGRNREASPDPRRLDPVDARRRAAARLVG